MRRLSTRWTARLFFAASLLFFLEGVAQHFGYDGVFIRGLAADVGGVHRDTPFIHRVDLYNLSFHPVEALVTPTCGCADEGPRYYRVAPFRFREIPITYRITYPETGRDSRAVNLVYKTGGHVVRKMARVYFEISP